MAGFTAGDGVQMENLANHQPRLRRLLFACKADGEFMITCLLRALMIVMIFAAASGNVRAQASAPQPEAAELLRPGDVVQLRIWREQDLSGEFPVDQAGDVVFPKIGVQKVTEQTPEALRERLLEQY